MSVDIVRDCYNTALESQVFEPKDSFLCKVQLDPKNYLIGVIRTPIPNPISIFEIIISDPDEKAVGIERTASLHNQDVIHDLSLSVEDMFAQALESNTTQGISLSRRGGKLIIVAEKDTTITDCLIENCSPQIQSACSLMDRLNTAFLSFITLQKPHVEFFTFA